MATPPPDPTPAQAVAAAGLAAFALGAALAAWAQGWHGGSLPSVFPLLGVCLGLVLGAWPRGSAQAALLFAVGAVGLALPPTHVASPELLEAVLLTACAAAVGSLLVRVGQQTSPLATTGAACLGVTLSTLSAALSTLPLLLGASCAVGIASWLLRGITPPAHLDAGGRLIPRAWVGLVSLRAGAALGVAICALVGLRPEGQTIVPALAVARAVFPLGVGLCLGLLLGQHRLAAKPAVLLLELPAWGLVGAAACWAPDWLASEGRGLFWVTAIGGLAAGVGLRAPLEAGGVWGLVALVLAWPLGPWALSLGHGHWKPEAALALALDIQRGKELREAASQERFRQRFVGGGVPVQVVDLEAGEQRVRVMSIAGAVTAGVPTHADAPREIMTASVLQAALPLLLSPQPPRRVALLGLDNGVTAGVALSAQGLTELVCVEPLAGVLAAHQDPGDLFGYVNQRPLDDPRTQVVRAAFPSWLRRADPVDLLLGGRAAPTPLLRSLTARCPLVAWTVARLRPEHRDLLGPTTWAFVAGDDALVLVRGVVGLDPTVIAARLTSTPRLVKALSPLELADPYGLLATLALGPGETLDIPAGGLSPRAVQLAGATGLPGALGWDGPEATTRLATLAERLALRMAPSALTMARAAVERGRTPRTLRVLGDVLRSAGRDEDALAAWEEALALDPASVSTRLSIAVFREGRREWGQGLEVLSPAEGVEPARDAQVHYHLGKLALGAKDYVRARKHLRTARQFKNAADLLGLARQLSGDQRTAAALTPTQRLEAAERLASQRKWDAAALAALALAHEPEALAASDRLRLAALLADLAPSRAPAAAKLLRGLEAEILAAHPERDSTPLLLRRALALAGAGDGEQAEGLLADLLSSPAARPQEAYRVLGDVRMTRESWAGAVDAYERYLQLDPTSSTHSHVYLAIADAARRMGRIERAIAALRTAERLLPGHPRVRLNLGTLLWDQGQRGEAREVYRAYLEVAPLRDPMRQRVQDLLRSE